MFLSAFYSSLNPQLLFQCLTKNRCLINVISVYINEQILFFTRYMTIGCIYLDVWFLDQFFQLDPLIKVFMLSSIPNDEKQTELSVKWDLKFRKLRVFPLRKLKKTEKSLIMDTYSTTLKILFLISSISSFF